MDPTIHAERELLVVVPLDREGNGAKALHETYSWGTIELSVHGMSGQKQGATSHTFSHKYKRCNDGESVLNEISREHYHN